MARDWKTDPTPCMCGARFRSMIAEARHRHNFPALCRRKKDGTIRNA
jgi:hypothetical protein